MLISRYSRLQNLLHDHIVLWFDGFSEVIKSADKGEMSVSCIQWGSASGDCSMLQYSSTLVAICSKFTGLGALFMLDCFKS